MIDIEATTSKCVWCGSSEVTTHKGPIPHPELGSVLACVCKEHEYLGKEDWALVCSMGWRPEMGLILPVEEK